MAYYGEIRGFFQNPSVLSGPAPIVVATDTVDGITYPTHIKVMAGQRVYFVADYRLWVYDDNGQALRTSADGQENWSWFLSGTQSPGFLSQNYNRIFSTPGTYDVSWQLITSFTPPNDPNNNQEASVPVNGYAMILVEVVGVEGDFVNNLVAGWEPIAAYNATPTGAIFPVPNAGNYIGWSGPIAASSILEYFRLGQHAFAKIFPLYVGDADRTFMQDTAPYNFGYPNWRQFTLDANRPARNASLTNYDNTDFGWWMNTNSIGRDSLPNVPNGLKGTTAANLYQGIQDMFAHMGHANAVYALHKVNNTVQGAAPSEVVLYPNAINDISYYKVLVKKLIENNKPFLIMLKSAIVENGANVIAESTMPDMWGSEAQFSATEATLKTSAQYNQDAGSGHPLHLANDTTATGNVYPVVGYILPTESTALPVGARNKFLLIIKDTGNVRNKNYYIALDSRIDTNDATEMSGWDALISTIIVSPTTSTYTSPRPTLQLQNGWGTGACLNVPKTLQAPIVGTGVPQQNRFTAVNQGYAITFHPLNTDEYYRVPPDAVKTFTTPGTHLVEVTVYDGVTYAFNTMSVVVSAPTSATFDLMSNLNQNFTGASAVISARNPYWLHNSVTPGTYLQANSSTIVVTQGDGSSAAGKYHVSSSVVGQPQNTTQQNLYVNFLVPGSYRITQSTTNGYCTSSHTMMVEVQALEAYINFDYTPPLVHVPINFSDTSPNPTTNWAWNFGDSTSSVLQNPVKTFTSPSTAQSPYPVTFTADTAVGRLSITKNVIVFYGSAEADFVYSPDVDIIAGVTLVDFVPSVSPNHPSFNPTYLWEFGDGSTSNLISPSHLYSTPGTYTVKLTYTVTVNGSQLVATKEKSIIITAAGLTAKSTTIIIPRNISHVLNLAALNNGDVDWTYELEPAGDNPNVKPNLVTPHLFEFTPNENFTGLHSYRYKLTNNKEQSAFGKISYIVREPKLELIVGSSSVGYSVSNNAFGDYDVSFGSVEIETEKIKPLILTNVGLGDLHIETMSLEGIDSDMFGLMTSTGEDVTQFTGLVLEPNETFLFRLKFTPTSTGRKKVRIKIKHN